MTPDSFYADSRTMDSDSIARRVEQMITEGADMIDIGGYSSRPGAGDVTPTEELRRLETGLAIIRKIAPEIAVSVDTFRADVARTSVTDLGADIINDISGGKLDPMMIQTVADTGSPYILMHMRGNPVTMQSMTDYNDVTADVIAELSLTLNELSLNGVCDVIVDPGFGFSKTLEQNYRLIHDLEHFAILGRPLLIGVSRKSMITRLLDTDADNALDGTTALNTIALQRGASILRVHDVAAAVSARSVVDAVNGCLYQSTN